jgi:flavin reductase (DIM6/NTAB) family NADH-FMN oxidoreductase RutF
MSFNPRLQRQIMGCLATGVTVVTVGRGDSLCAMTANSVMSLSLAPPLILIAVNKGNRTAQMISENRCFAVNVLTVEQEPIARRFATNGLKDFSGISFKSAETGAPVLKDTLAWVDCRVVDVLSGGDHDIFIGQITAGDSRSGSPLLFYGGCYARLSESPR